MSKKHTIEEVREFVESQGYTLISDVYKDNKTKLKMVCNKGHNVEMSFNSFKNRGSRCKICVRKINGKKRRIPYEEVRKNIENEGYKLISKEYKDGHFKLEIKCPYGHIFKMEYFSFKNGTRCPQCMRKISSNKRKTPYEEVKEYIESQGYILISKDYKNNNTPIEVMCDKGHKYITKYHYFKTGGNRCPVCFGTPKKNIKEIRNYINSTGYKLISDDYINNKSKLKIECNKGHQFETSWISFSHMNSRCPICNNSKGEEEIKTILDNYKVIYQTQKRFKDCRYKKPLPFDFYIPDMNICIEYDGEQHFKPITYSKDKNKNIKGFKDTQLRDSIKDQYCKDNNIKLIRIPYTEFDNIEDILIKELNLKKVV